MDTVLLTTAHAHQIYVGASKASPRRWIILDTYPIGACHAAKSIHIQSMYVTLLKESVHQSCKYVVNTRTSKDKYEKGLKSSIYILWKLQKCHFTGPKLRLNWHLN